jgi:hypothetical protein
MKLPIQPHPTNTFFIATVYHPLLEEREAAFWIKRNNEGVRLNETAYTTSPNKLSIHRNSFPPSP